MRIGRLGTMELRPDARKPKVPKMGKRWRLTYNSDFKERAYMFEALIQVIIM